MSLAYVKSVNISDLHPKSQYFSNHVLPDQDMYLGVSATETLTTLKTQARPEELKKFYTS